MKVVRITNSHFETDGGGNAIEKFVGGKFYPVTPDTQRQVDLRNGEIIDAPDDAVKATAAAEALEAAAKKADDKAEVARDAAEAAAAAQAIDAAAAAAASNA